MLDTLKLFDAGYTALVSVVPPHGVVAAHSKLQQKDAGKSPGIRNHLGEYVGYPWLRTEPTRQQVHQWAIDGSSVGFGGWEYPAFDIDIVDEEIADACVAAIETLLGPCVLRYGRKPKVMVIGRSDEPLRSFDVHYKGGHPLLGEEKHLIQFLGAGRQYVMVGTHPVTMAPYTTVDPIHALGIMGPEALPLLTPAVVAEIFEALNAVLASFDFTTESRANAEPGSGDVSQESLSAPSAEALHRLVDQLPNTAPDREEYITVGYAIKGASLEFPEAGREAFQSWCARWDGGHNDPELVDIDWNKMSPPFRAGYDLLLAKGNAWGANVSDFVFGAAETPPEPSTAAEPPPEPSTAADDSATLEAANYSDVSLAEGFMASTKGGVFAVPAMGKDAVYFWQDGHWVAGGESRLFAEITKYLKRVFREAQILIENPSKLAEIGMRLGSLHSIKTVASIVLSQESISKTPEQVDANPDIINTPEGAVDLRKGTLLPPSRGRFVTKCTAVSLGSTDECPLWLKFIDESMGGQEDMKLSIQRLAGYALTGHTREQTFPIFIGAGKNGKSTFVGILAKLMADYATHLPADLFEDGRRGGDAAYHVANLKGARLAVTSETRVGAKWNEQFVKQITGDDALTGRHPYGRPFTFHAQATVIMTSNYTPDLTVVGVGISRRMNIIPWEYAPVIPDKDLSRKLGRELPGILAWAVEGARGWYESGMPSAAAADEETKEYLIDQDAIGEWMMGHLTITNPRGLDVPAFTHSHELYDSYRMWMMGRRAAPLAFRTFAQAVAPRIRARGARMGRVGNGPRGWSGVTITHDHSRDADLPPNVTKLPAYANPGLAKPRKK